MWVRDMAPFINLWGDFVCCFFGGIGTIKLTA
jgi:hypothetical protein